MFRKFLLKSKKIKKLREKIDELKELPEDKVKELKKKEFIETRYYDIEKDKISTLEDKVEKARLLKMNDKRWESNLKKLAKSLIKVETVNNSEREGLYEICFLEIRKHNIWKKSGWKVEKLDFFKKGDIVLVPYTIKDSFTTLTDVSTSMFLSLTTYRVGGNNILLANYFLADRTPLKATSRETNR